MNALLAAVARTTPGDLEVVVTFLAIVAAFALPGRGAELFRSVERGCLRLARKRGLAVTVVGATALALRLALLPLSPIPAPFTPDDFSFLLSADTLAHGRLANPTPALWTHFESIHITMIPTYASMYFPAQGLALAAGKVLFGHPWYGLLLVNSLMCAAICWMLQAWLPPGWAFLGGMLAVMRLALFSYWINTYTGGASIVALGGALVLGALPRLTRNLRLRDGLMLALGISILLISRPFEGLLLCLPVAIALGRWLMVGKNSPAPAVLLRRAALPLCLVAVAAAWLALYDYRAFGKPSTLPYTLDRAQYAVEPYWAWQPPPPEPAYRHKVMRDFYVKAELPVVTDFRAPHGAIRQTIWKPIHALMFFSGAALLFPLVMLHRVLLDRRMRFLILAIAVLIAGMLIEIVLLPHYLAAFTAAFYAVGLACMRHLRLWKPLGKPVGVTLVRYLVIVCVVLTPLRAFAGTLHLRLADWPPSAWTATWYGSDQMGAPRARVQAQLESMPGSQLVLVRYSPLHNPVGEWVYNDANLETSKVIWAREMDSAANLELIQHYKNRKVWLVEPDQSPVSPIPYPVVSSPISANKPQ